MKIRLGAAALCLPVLATVPPAAAQIPLGEPFIVNTTTAGDQQSPDVAVAPDGDRVERTGGYLTTTRLHDGSVMVVGYVGSGKQAPVRYELF